MAKTIATRKRIVRRDWTRADVKELRQHSRDKTSVKAISRALRRFFTIGHSTRTLSQFVDLLPKVCS